MVAPEAPTKIFISYRRAGESGYVRGLTERLSSFYGAQNVVRDISVLRSGEEFEGRILSTLSGSAVVIAVMGADWVGRRSLRSPRILSKDDWVRREIEHALASGIPVIPVLVGDAELPKRSQLPASLRGLLSVQAARVRDESWEEDCSKLVSAINEVVKGGAGEGGGGGPSVWRAPEVREAGRPGLVIPAIVLSLAALVGTALWLYLRPSRPPAQNAPAPNSVKLEDPSTWALPREAEVRSPVAYRALRLALDEMQTSTTELGGDSAGYNVKKFTQRFGPQLENAPWSGAFVTWCYLEGLRRVKNNGDAQLPFTDSPANMAVAASLRSKGWLVEPFDASKAKPGDIVFLGRVNQPIGHAEIIYAVGAGNVCSIGGNVNNRVSGQCRRADADRLVALGAIPAEAFGESPAAAR